MTQLPFKVCIFSLLALAAKITAAETETPAFRTDSPVLVTTELAPQQGVNPVSHDEVALRSAIVAGTAGVANSKEFVPTSDAGEGNFESRPYRFTLSLSNGYDDNIYTSSFDQQESFFTSASLGATLRLGDGQTSFEAALRAGGSYYWDRDDNFDPDLSFALTLTHVFNKRLTLVVTSSILYQAEPDFASTFGETRRNGDYFYGNIGLNLSHIFARRFSAVYSYTVGGVFYDSDNSIDGAGADDRVEQTFGLQLRYLLKPTVTLVGEYRFGIITYDSDNRDSISHYLLGGVDFTLNRRLTATVRVGAQLRDSDDQGEESSPFLESTLSYKYASRSTVQWYNRYGFEESDFGQNSTRRTYRTGLTVTHGFGPRISVNASAYYTNSSYDGNTRGGSDDEQTLDLNVGATYLFNRLLSFQVGYTHTEVYSDNDFREYDRNRIFAGATFSF